MRNTRNQCVVVMRSMPALNAFPRGANLNFFSSSLFNRSSCTKAAQFTFEPPNGNDREHCTRIIMRGLCYFCHSGWASLSSHMLISFLTSLDCTVSRQKKFTQSFDTLSVFSWRIFFLSSRSRPVSHTDNLGLRLPRQQSRFFTSV